MKRKQRDDMIAKYDKKIFWLSASILPAFMSAATGSVWYLVPIPFYVIGILWYQRRIRKVRWSR
jgi:hypothetical protein